MDNRNKHESKYGSKHTGVEKVDKECAEGHRVVDIEQMQAEGRGI